jgi:hypothetical protein
MASEPLRVAHPLRMTLRYTGRDVDNGTMRIDEVVEGLQGFSGAYQKAAVSIDPDSSYELRVSATRTGSFEVLILGWIAGQYGEQLKAVESITHAARYVFGLIVDVIHAKKHAKAQPYTVSVKGDKNVVTIINADKVELKLPIEAFELFASKTLDPDLNKIAAPLRQESIEAAELIATDETRLIEATITSAEKEYFKPDAGTVTSKEVEMTGTLISLNKETNRGTFKLSDNTNVPYHYAGENPERFHADFSYKGPVRVRCIGHFDENLKLVRLEIKSVERLQGELPFDIDTHTTA